MFLIELSLAASFVPRLFYLFSLTHEPVHELCLVLDACGALTFLVSSSGDFSL